MFPAGETLFFPKENVLFALTAELLTLKLPFDAVLTERPRSIELAKTGAWRRLNDNDIPAAGSSTDEEFALNELACWAVPASPALCDFTPAKLSPEIPVISGEKLANAVDEAAVSTTPKLDSVKAKANSPIRTEPVTQPAPKHRSTE